MAHIKCGCHVRIPSLPPLPSYSPTWACLARWASEYCIPAAGVCFTILVIQVLSWANIGICHFNPLSEYSISDNIFILVLYCNKDELSLYLSIHRYACIDGKIT